jgi:hypothetical protein
MHVLHSSEKLDNADVSTSVTPELSRLTISVMLSVTFNSDGFMVAFAKLDQRVILPRNTSASCSRVIRSFPESMPGTLKTIATAPARDGSIHKCGIDGGA